MNMIQKIEHSKNLIREHINKYKRIGLAVSWGKDSIVVLHLARQVDPNIPCFTILTRFKPKETFEYKDKLIKEWNLNIKEYMSDAEIPNDLYKTNPDECCRILKVEPTKEAVKDLDCWITGLRNTEGRTRKDYKEVEEKEGLIKLNPILTWTENEIWQYIAVNNLPVHPWYAKGYRSLGCAPCTRLIDSTEDERMGRWQGTSKCGGECGIHTHLLKGD